LLLGTLEIGYASPSCTVKKTAAHNLSACADFVEIPVHDNLRPGIDRLFIADNYEGFITLHGEGETDGLRRIRFSCPNKQDRVKYTKRVVRLFNYAMKAAGTVLVQAAIIHPDTLHRGRSRASQIEWLAESLMELSSGCNIPEICIEPRGGDRQRKVVRSHIQDVLLLNEMLEGGTKISYCIDLAQTYCAHGFHGVLEMIDQCLANEISIRELHASDVIATKRSKRLGMEIGTGEVDFSEIMGKIQGMHCRLLIETLGGFPVFSRSLTYLTQMEAKRNAILL
jgi:sugar phosphate isomerase/epimerase